MTRRVKMNRHVGLGLRLRRARKEARILPTQLADQAGLSGSVVNYIETEGRMPAIDTLERLADVIGVSACWLAYGEAHDPAPVPEGPPRCSGVGERVRAARLAHGLSRNALGKSSGTSDVTVMHIEEGQVQPRVDTVEKLAVALELSPCWLAYGIGEGPPEGSATGDPSKGRGRRGRRPGPPEPETPLEAGEARPDYAGAGPEKPPAKPPQRPPRAERPGRGTPAVSQFEVRITEAGRCFATVVDGKPVVVRIEAYKRHLAMLLAAEAPTAAELRGQWVWAHRRRALLHRLAAAGAGPQPVQQAEHMEAYDLYDVLAELAYGAVPRTRAERAAALLQGQRPWWAAMRAQCAAVVKALVQRFAREGIEELDRREVFAGPLVSATGGFAAVATLGDTPQAVLREIKDRLLAL